MCNLERFKIDLKNLIDETTTVSYDLDDSYFQALEGAEIESGVLHVSVSIRKVSGFFEFLFHTKGMVIVTCDRCLDAMEQPIEGENRVVVKLGAEYSEEDDTITIDEDEGILDVAWLIYEFIELAIPIKHVHAPGKCDPAMTKVLEELSADRSSDEASEQPIDPRWEKLKDLKV